ncbi:hypothetical protein FGB62_76g071 [Gracilaria domingensis]|nr:hypothetical protein FGB62_76g071 [Gracilaria domingensis]
MGGDVLRANIATARVVEGAAPHGVGLERARHVDGGATRQRVHEHGEREARKPKQRHKRRGAHARGVRHRDHTRRLRAREAARARPARKSAAGEDGRRAGGRTRSRWRSAADAAERTRPARALLAARRRQKKTRPNRRVFAHVMACATARRSQVRAAQPTSL